MSRLHGVFVCIALAGCGRLGFDHTRGDAAGEIDAPVIASRCGALAGELFCESFEGAPQLTTVDATPPGFVRVESMRAARGTRALHARTTGANEPAWILGGALPDVTAGELYARWYIYVPAGATRLELASVHIVDSVTPFPGVVVGVRDGLMDLVSSKAGDYVVSQLAVPRDRWACVQLHITISPTAGVVESWLDGAPAGQLTGIDTQPGVSYRNVHAGIFATSLATEPQEAWTDEIAVATAPISCD